MKIQIGWIAPLLLGSIMVAGCNGNHGINGAISIPDGTETGDVSNVNGSITIGTKAHVAGVHSVNGSLALGKDARASYMKTVNGSVDLAARSEVSGNIDSVNGALTLAPGSTVKGDLVNVNGAISVDGAHVGGGLRTVNASINLVNGARVDSGIVVWKSGSSFGLDKSTPPRVVIGRDVTVNGTLEFNREVRLYVSDKAAHVGKIEGATPISYQGDDAPR